MNSSRMLRGALLYQQGRWSQAEQEFRLLLSEDVDNASAHRLLAYCLLHLERLDEAQSEARAAIALEPGEAENHRLLGSLLTVRLRFPEARASADEAMRLDPDDADNFALSAHLHLAQYHWAEALFDAERGLQADPSHIECTNLRAQALTRLGRRSEAGLTLTDALRRAPEDSDTHANMGWNQLEARHPKQAMEHFREALRLDPGNEWAREGIVEALKARHLPYRLLLGWFFWLSNFSPRVQFGILAGVFFGQQVVGRMAQSIPILWVVCIAMILFALSTWLASPLYNLLLFVDPMGRLALSEEDCRGAITVDGILLATAGLAAWGLTYGHQVHLWGALYLLISALPASTIFCCPARKWRWVMTAATAVVAFMAVWPVIVYQLAYLEWIGIPTAVNQVRWVLDNFFLVAIGSQVLGNVAMTRREAR